RRDGDPRILRRLLRPPTPPGLKESGGKEEPAALGLPGADLLLYGLCRSCRAHHRAGGGAADGPAAQFRPCRSVDVRPSGARGLALRQPCRWLRRLLFEPPQAEPEFLAALSLLARRPWFGALPVQRRYPPLRLARSPGRRLRRHH